ncbi:hypothetical protein GCM10010208_05570 [Actinomadura livida]|nr:hypothetical protein GCM10010208_05570 [Actinomadura livida]
MRAEEPQPPGRAVLTPSDHHAGQVDVGGVRDGEGRYRFGEGITADELQPDPSRTVPVPHPDQRRAEAMRQVGRDPLPRIGSLALEHPDQHPVRRGTAADPDQGGQVLPPLVHLGQTRGDQDRLPVPSVDEGEAPPGLDGTGDPADEGRTVHSRPHTQDDGDEGQDQDGDGPPEPVAEPAEPGSDGDGDDVANQEHQDADQEADGVDDEDQALGHVPHRRRPLGRRERVTLGFDGDVLAGGELAELPCHDGSHLFFEQFRERRRGGRRCDLQPPHSLVRPPTRPTRQAPKRR